MRIGYVPTTRTVNGIYRVWVPVDTADRWDDEPEETPPPIPLDARPRWLRRAAIMVNDDGTVDESRRRQPEYPPYE